MDKKPIGMFDSGVGGITVFSEIVKQLPNEDIIYLGDTKQFPYGNKSKEIIIELSKKNIEFLIEKGVKIIIIACGTATSQALEEVSAIYKIPIVGIIKPTVDELGNDKTANNIGIIATPGTINSKSWEKEIKNNIKGVNVISKGCSLLAPMAEEGWTENKIAKLTLEEYLKGFEHVDKLILGCTHYPLFTNLIKEILGNDKEIINTGEKLSKYLKQYLLENDMENVKEHRAEYKFYLTDIQTKFINIAKQIIENKQIITENNVKGIVI